MRNQNGNIKKNAHFTALLLCKFALITHNVHWSVKGSIPNPQIMRCFFLYAFVVVVFTWAFFAVKLITRQLLIMSCPLENSSNDH